MKERAMRTNIGLNIVLAMAGLLNAAMAVADDSYSLIPRHSWPGKDVANTGDVAPAFHLMDIRGEELVYLSAYRGKRVILYFTASWAKSATQLVRLKRFHEEFAPKGHEVLGISVDVVPRMRMMPLLRSIGVDELPFVVDPMLMAAEEFGLHSAPALFLVDEHGKILLREEPISDASFPNVIRQITDLMAMPMEPDPGTGEGRLAPKQVCHALEAKIIRDPEVFVLRQQVAVAYYDAGLYDKSFSQFQVASAIEPNRPLPIIRWRMGVTLDALRDREKALTFWRSACSSFGSIPVFTKNLDAIDYPEKYYRDIPSVTDVQ